MKAINTAPIETFMERAAKMAAGRSKEMRMTADEVNELTASIAQVLARLTSLQENLVGALNEPIVVHASGGSFGKDS